MASSLTVRNHKFSEGSFSTPVISGQRLSFLAHRAAAMTKTDLIFAAFSSRIADFAVQFCYRCKFPFNEEPRSSQV